MKYIIAGPNGPAKKQSNEQREDSIVHISPICPSDNVPVKFHYACFATQRSHRPLFFSKEPASSSTAMDSVPGVRRCFCRLVTKLPAAHETPEEFCIPVVAAGAPAVPRAAPTEPDPGRLVLVPRVPSAAPSTRMVLLLGRELLRRERDSMVGAGARLALSADSKSTMPLPFKQALLLLLPLTEFGEAGVEGTPLMCRRGSRLQLSCIFVGEFR